MTTFIEWCYCVRARDCCCVLCDVTRDLLFTWYTAISRKVVGKSARDNSRKALWVVLSALFFKELVRKAVEMCGNEC